MMAEYGSAKSSSVSSSSGGECTPETVGVPCGDGVDPDTGVGYVCCYGNLGQVGCFGAPRSVFACESEDWCTNCPGGIETRVGPYNSQFEAVTAAQASFDENCTTGGSVDTETCDGGTTYYGFICCQDEAP